MKRPECEGTVRVKTAETGQSTSPLAKLQMQDRSRGTGRREAYVKQRKLLDVGSKCKNVLLVPAAFALC